MNEGVKYEAKTYTFSIWNTSDYSVPIFYWTFCLSHRHIISFYIMCHDNSAHPHVQRSIPLIADLSFHTGSAFTVSYVRTSVDYPYQQEHTEGKPHFFNSRNFSNSTIFPDTTWKNRSDYRFLSDCGHGSADGHHAVTASSKTL